MATTPSSESSGKLAFWDTPQEPVLELHNGRVITKTEYLNKGGPEKFGHGNTIDVKHYRRQCGLPGCDLEPLVLDNHGYSFCPKCHTIYNDGKPPMRPKTSDQIIEAFNISRRQRNSALKKACRC